MNGMTKMNVNVVVLKVVILSLSQTHITHTPHTNKKNDVQNTPHGNFKSSRRGVLVFFFYFLLLFEDCQKKTKIQKLFGIFLSLHFKKMNGEKKWSRL